MKKKKITILISIIAILVALFLGKQVLKKGNSAKPSIDLTVYTISSSDTEKWNKIKQIETEEGVYPITVKRVESSEEMFSKVIQDGASMGFGVSEKEVKQFNSKLNTSIEDSKKNKLIGLEFLTFSSDNEGFVIANFDYGREEFNSQKKNKEELYKKLYETFKG